MSRVLFLGDLAATGFGTVTMDLGRAMLAAGEDVRFVSLNELGDLPEPFASRTMRETWLTVPTNAVEAEAYLAHQAGLFTADAWEDGWAPEAAILLADFEAMRQFINRIPVPSAIPIFHYVPIEGTDLPPRWAIQWKVLRPVAMSEFGADQIESVTGARPPMVYHGVDAHAFRPVTTFSPLRMGDAFLRSRADCRAFFTRDAQARAYHRDRLWLLRTDRHMPRKRTNDLLRSMVPVLDAIPNANLILHCAVSDQGGNLLDQLSKYPEWFQHRVMLTGAQRTGQASREEMVALYNAADLYVSNGSEGFGLTIAEALACGTPAVGINYSAVPEVIGPGGALVDEVHLFDNVYDHSWAVADNDAFGAVVTRLLLHPAGLRKLGAKGTEHVRRSFRWDHAARQFSELIAAATRSEVAA